MHIFVTGANGYIGSKFVIDCISRGYKISAVKRTNSNLERLGDIRKKINWCGTEINAIKDLFKKENKVDAIVHTATSYGRNSCAVSEVIESNILFPLTLLEIAIENRVELFLNLDTFFSASANNRSYLNSYGMSKKNFIEYAEIINKEKIKFVNLIIHHVYGPNDGKEKFITRIIQELMANQFEIKLTHGQQIRDFIFVDDVISAIQAVLTNRTMLIGNKSHLLDVGSGVSYTVEHFIRQLHKKLNSNATLNFGAKKIDGEEVMIAKADVGPLNRLGWKPQFQLHQGIDQIVKYYQ